MTDLQAIIDSMLDVNWTPLAEQIQRHGSAYIRVIVTTNGLVLEAVAPHHTHCPTCQCNKFPPTPPMPENPRSRSWHENALTEPPK